MTKHSGHTNYWAVSGWIGLIAIIFVLLPEVTLAQTTFKSIVDIPGITGEAGSTENFGLYINALYIFAITVGAMLAVLKLVAAGVKYMFSDIVTNKEAAKSDIKGALLGLLIVIGAVVILNTVNTDLTNADLNLEPVDTNTSPVFQLALDRIKTLVDGCTIDNNCIIRDCPFNRDGSYFSSCETWCENAGSDTTYISNGLLSYATGGAQITAQCVIRNVSTPDDDERLSCEDLGTTDDGLSLGFDCSEAITYCENELNGTPTETGGGSTINCAQ